MEISRAKIICIEEYTFHSTFTDRTFKVGEEFILQLHQFPDGTPVDTLTVYDPKNSGGYIMSSKKMMKYFGTLKEYRKLKLNKINELNENNL